MSITVTLTPATRSGICSLPLAALATESVTFTGANLADGVIVTVMQPDGTPVASGSVASGAVELDLNTKEAHRATVTLPVGETTKAFLVIGDTDALRFVVPALLQRNYLDDVIPPTATVPVYPTQAELDAILAELGRVQGLVADQLEEAGRLDASMQTTVTNFNAAVTVADTMLQRVVTEGVEEIGGAVTAGKTEIDEAKTAAVKAVTDKATEVSGELDGAVADAETALQGKVDAATQSIAESTATATNAASNAAKAQGKAEEAETGAEAAKEAAETALNNGCVYKVVALGNSSIIALQRETTIYKITPLGSCTIAFNPPTLAEGEVIVFWLWIVMGETAYELTIPASFIGFEPALAANTETLLALMSTDGGATWQANVQWEREVA